MTERPNVLECTLRDGSYAVDFQFTPRDTALVALALESTGVHMIEIGHGLGLNASAHRKAAAQDAEYMEAANALTTASWGMFCIPGIARLEDLNLAASFGMGFVRIGVNVSDVAMAAPYLERARELGLFACANIMKSYVAPPEQLARLASGLESFGAQVVYVVDSAGHMLPNDVEAYVTALRESISIPIGWHGHDNLRLGIANAIKAVECGACYIDTTLKGLGRGGGNPSTEVFVATMLRAGLETGIDLHGILDIGQRLISPMLSSDRLDPLHVACGLVGFHSGFLPQILNTAATAGVDPAALIIEVGKCERETPTTELMAAVADSLAREKRPARSISPQDLPLQDFPSFSRTQVLGWEQSLGRLCRDIFAKARTSASQAVLNIYSPIDVGAETWVSPIMNEGFGHIIGSVVPHKADLNRVVSLADGLVDIIFADAERKAGMSAPLFASVKAQTRKSLVLPYRDSDVWRRSVTLQIISLAGDLSGLPVTICGEDPMSLRLALDLLDAGASVTLNGKPSQTLQEAIVAMKHLTMARCMPTINPVPLEATATSRFLVSFGPKGVGITEDMVAALPKGAIIIDAGIGSLSPEALALAWSCGIVVMRPDMRSAMAAELNAVRDTDRALRGAGRTFFAGEPVVAGGCVGHPGDVVLNSVTAPSTAYGVSDGMGRLYSRVPKEHAERLRRVEAAILRKQIGGEDSCQ